MPFSVAEIVNDPDFAQSFAITRSQGGSWVQGNWTNTTVTVDGFGTIQPATEKELDMLPDGDRSTEVMMFHSSDPIYETQVAPSEATSDILVWNDTNYRVMKVREFQDFGYWEALAVRMVGA